jgi:pilus assembly protein CpaE
MSAHAPEPLRSLRVLVVGGDARLESELADALASTTEARTTLHWSQEYDGAQQAVRARRPDLVCIELGSDASALHVFVSTLRALAPEVPIVGVRVPSAAGSERSDVLVEALRAGFIDVIDRPLSSTDLRRLLPRVADAVRAREREGRVILFHSTKGGVGKSTLSVNVSCALAKRSPDRVLLIDASLQLGVCAAALDLEGKTTIADASRERERLDETLVRELAERHESGLRVLASPRGPVDAADVDDEALARIVSIAKRAFDVVVVDTLPVVDGAMLTLIDLADHLYLVNQGTVPDVIGAAQLLETLDGLGIGPERRSIVLNRNLPRFAGELSAPEVSDRLGQAVDFELPHEKKVLTALNIGEPLILRARRRFGWGRAMAALVDDVIARGAVGGVRGVEESVEESEPAAWWSRERVDG